MKATVTTSMGLVALCILVPLARGAGAGATAVLAPPSTNQAATVTAVVPAAASAPQAPVGSPAAPAAAVPAPMAPVTAAAATVPAPPEVAEPTGKPSSSIIIEYIEADIQNVLRTLAAKAGTNLIMGDEVTGKVTVHLEGVTYDEAIRLIAESKGYACLREHSVLKIRSKEALETEPLELRPCTLNYAKAEDVKKVIDPGLSARGKIQVDVRSNTLIISDTPSSLTRLLPLIQSLDTQTPQVMIEAKFVETTKNPKKDLGINWSGTLLNHQLTAGSDVVINSVNGKPVSGFQLTKPLGHPSGAWVPATALLDGGQAQLVFSYLNSDADTELLANPRVVTTDNGKARIAIATQFPIPNFQFSEQTASLQVNGFTYKDIGIILSVTPRINKNQFITLEVAPEASSTTSSTTLSSGGGSSVQIPIIDARTATTTVLIKSGNTLAIGGLMRQDVQNVFTKVPIMGDIPGLGALFRSKSLSKTKRDLLIFLTPTIVGPEAETGSEKQVGVLRREEIYTDDTWMPHDNAKPRSLFQGKALAAPAAAPQAESVK